MQSSYMLWILAGLGLISLFANKDAKKRALFVFGLLLFSFLAVCPGFYFRSHYFIVMLPVLAILNGIAVSTAFSMARKVKSHAVHLVAILVFIFILGYSIFQQRTVFFTATPREVCRISYGAACFPEALEVGRYIRENSSENDQIVVLGSSRKYIFIRTGFQLLGISTCTRSWKPVPLLKKCSGK